MKFNRGFTLIEVIVVLLLIGILAVGGSLFLINGVQGYMFAARNSEMTLKVDNALERLTIELRDATAITLPNSSAAATSISYDIMEGTTSVSKTISFNSGLKVLTITGYGPTGTPLVGTPPTLLDNVGAFSLSVVCDNLDPLHTGNEVRYVSISTTIVDIPTPFTTKVYPRNTNYPINCPY